MREVVVVDRSVSGTNLEARANEQRDEKPPASHYGAGRCSPVPVCLPGGDGGYAAGMVAEDRIADPWGIRTPYGAGRQRPPRVDMHLDEGLAAEDVEKWVQTASVLHSNGDAFDIAVKNGRMVGVRGRDVDRVNRGRLGPKDLFGRQANSSPERLTRPLIRENGELVATDWDTAMNRIVEHSKHLLSEQGPSAIGFYTSGQLFLEEYYTLGVIAHGAIGTDHVDGNTRLCTATAAEALKESFACDGQPGSYTDIDHADVIALFGHNMAETQPMLWARRRSSASIPDRPRSPNTPPSGWHRYRARMSR